MQDARPLRAQVPANRWDLLDLPDERAPDALRSVSVVVPTKDQPLLRRTTRALGQQTYPSHLVELIVVDDGSDPPVTLDDIDPSIRERTRVVRQDREGFGAGAARALGASEATGDVLAFLDADILVPPGYLMAHTRWTEAADHAVVIGQVRMLASDEDPEPTLAAGRVPAWSPVEWTHRLHERTDGLTSDDPDIWTATAGASLTVTRRFYTYCGGFRGLGLRGIEDIEFGFRAYTAGALLVPDDEGHGWHPPVRYFSDRERADAAKERRAELLADLVPVPRMRSTSSQRVRSVPRAHVFLLVTARDSTTEVLAAVDQLLVRLPVDAHVELVLEGQQPSRAVVLDGVRADPRITVVERHPRDDALVAPRIGVCAVATVTELLPLLDEVAVGQEVLGATVGAERPVVALSGRAYNRSRFLSSPSGAVLAEGSLRLAHELFPASWRDATRPGAGRDAAVATSAEGAEHLVAAMRKLERDLQSTRRQLETLKRRRVVRAANAVGRLRSGRR